MKKLLSAVACTLLFASGANADFLRLEAGAGAWQQTPTGGLTANTGSFTGKDVSTEKEQTNAYAWVMFKHFIPIIPNLRVEYATVKSDGVATGSFANFTATSTPSALEIKQYDLIPYYNLLDNTAWLTLDVGIDIKMIDMSYTADNVTLTVPTATASTSYSDSKMIPIPMAYARTRFQIPMTGLGFEADGKYISYSDTTVYDARAKIDYTFNITPIIQPGIEIGYRVQKFESNDLDNVNLNIEFKGVYAGLMVRF